METEKELNAKIMAISQQIREKYPELVKYLDEMTITIPDEKKPEMNIKALKEYYDSLTSMLKKYEIEHPTSGIIPGKK